MQTIKYFDKKIIARNSIDQKRYKRQFFQFQAILSAFQRQKQNCLSKNFTFIIVLRIFPQQVLLTYQKKVKNRIMQILASNSDSQLIFLKFDQFKIQPSFARECLNHPVVINKQSFNFLGYSKSNLKHFACYFLNQTLTKINQLIESLGHFHLIKEVSKKAARLSLLYSQSNIVCFLRDNQINYISDVTRDEFCFTDGCGYISIKLARRIKKHIKERMQIQLQYLPAVYQIRIKGIKGIVIIHPGIQNQQLAIRHSMVKFKAKQNQLNQLFLVNFSKPSNYASINQQIIMLLSGLGINGQYFLKLQADYLTALRQAMKQPQSHIRLLKFLGKEQQIESVMKRELTARQVKTLIYQQIYKNIRSQQLKLKLRVPLQNARILYGTVFPDLLNKHSITLNPLSANQIFLRVTTQKGVVETIVGKVIVTKNPCYYCGDIRILNAVDISDSFPFANKLIDIIIFSVQGERPICSTMAGSDYDGDQYFVCWDQNLIPDHEVQPYSYPKAKIKQSQHQITQSDLIDHLVNYDRSIVGKLDSRFQSIARVASQGVNCQECILIGTELFSKAIDSALTGQKIEIPQCLRKNWIQRTKEEHVWVKMERIYQNFLAQELKVDQELIENWQLSFEGMLGLVQLFLSSEHYSDFQLFKLVREWYSCSGHTDYGLFQYVNYSQFSNDQRKEVLKTPCLPKHLVYDNPFQSSPVFDYYLFKQNGFQQSFQLSPFKWRPFYKSHSKQLNFPIVQQAFNKFSYILIGIRVNREVRLALNFSQLEIMSNFQNQLSHRNMAVYYGGFNQFKQFYSFPDQVPYRLYYAEDIIQIYQKERKNSFVWFKKGKLSVDLTRFDRYMLRKHPKINKEEIQFVQIYVNTKEEPRLVKINKKYVSQTPRQKCHDNDQFQDSQVRQKSRFQGNRQQKALKTRQQRYEKKNYKYSQSKGGPRQKTEYPRYLEKK